MYRNIYYEIGPETNWEGKVHLFTWDKNGNPITEVYDHESHLYRETADGEHDSMFDTRLRRLDFKSVIDRSRWIKEHPTEKLYESFTGEKEFLYEMYQGQQEDPDFQKHSLRIHYLDIEFAADEEPFLLVKEKVNKAINVISIYDNVLDEYNVWVLRNPRWCSPDLDFPDRENIKFHVFDREVDMYKYFLVWYQDNYPDVITGWNVEDFDMPYLIDRMEQFIGDSVKLMSPLGIIKKGTRTQRAERPYELQSYKIRGISVLDYLILYRNIFTTKRSGYKLGDVGQDELGYGKLEYEGSIKDFYRRDFKKFVEYNIIDVKLVKDLDLKKRFIDLARTICNMGLCEYENIFNSSPYILGALRLQANEMGLKVITKNPDNMGLEASFVGGYVFDPKIGNYRHGQIVIDFNSLYPNVMIMNNISPETKFGKILDEDDENVVVRFNKTGDVKTINKKKFIEHIDGKLCKAANNVLYINPLKKKGIIPAFLERLYANRVSVKKEMKGVYKEIDIINKKIEKLSTKGEEPKIKKAIKLLNEKAKELEIEAQRLDTVQYAFKIFLNSVYGQMGSVWFPFFDIDNAEAVTLGGQHLNKSSAVFVGDFITKEFGGNPDDIPVYGDTDSIMCNIEVVVEQLVGRKREWTDEDIEKITEYTDGKLIKALNENVRRICKEDFLSPMENVIFERETLAKESTFVAKKKYLMHVRDDEGKVVDKWKITGIDIKQNALPPKIKDCLKHIIFNSLLEEWDAGKYRQELIKIWDEFKTIPVEELSIYKGYRTERLAAGFLQMEKGTTGQAKAALHYNQIIEKLGLEDKYSKISVGDVIRVLYILKSNNYGINVIGWPDIYPEEFKDIFEIDYEVMFQKTVLNPLKRFIAINKWNNVKPYQTEMFDINLL